MFVIELTYKADLGEIAHRIAATSGITRATHTRATHKIVSIKILVIPARVPGEPPLGEQLVHWSVEC